MDTSGIIFDNTITSTGGTIAVPGGSHTLLNLGADGTIRNIVGSGTIVVRGNFTLTLVSSNNTFQGTWIFENNLVLSSGGGAFGNSNNPNNNNRIIFNGANLQSSVLNLRNFDADIDRPVEICQDTVIGHNITGTPINPAQTAGFNFNRSVTFTGDNVLTVRNNNINFNNDVILNGATTFLYTSEGRAGDNRNTGNFSGTGSLLKQGGGDLTMFGSNTFSGDLNIQNGRVVLGSELNENVLVRQGDINLVGGNLHAAGRVEGNIDIGGTDRLHIGANASTNTVGSLYVEGSVTSENTNSAIEFDVSPIAADSLTVTGNLEAPRVIIDYLPGDYTEITHTLASSTGTYTVGTPTERTTVSEVTNDGGTTTVTSGTNNQLTLAITGQIDETFDADEDITISDPDDERLDDDIQINDGVTVGIENTSPDDIVYTGSISGVGDVVFRGPGPIVVDGDITLTGNIYIETDVTFNDILISPTAKIIFRADTDRLTETDYSPHLEILSSEDIYEICGIQGDLSANNIVPRLTFHSPAPTEVGSTTINASDTITLAVNAPFGEDFVTNARIIGGDRSVFETFNKIGLGDQTVGSIENVRGGTGKIHSADSDNDDITVPGGVGVFNGTLTTTGDITAQSEATNQSVDVEIHGTAVLSTDEAVYGTIKGFDGGTFAGKGRVNGNIDLNSGQLSPTAGQITIAGDLNTNANSIVNIDLLGPTGTEGNDKILITGDANYGGTLNVNIADATFADDSNVVMIATNSGGGEGDFGTRNYIDSLTTQVARPIIDAGNNYLTQFEEITRSISIADDSVNEGDTFNITLDTNLREGTIIPYTITGIQSSDIENALQGNFVVDRDGNNTIAITTVADTTSEGDETLTISLINHPTVTDNITISDTSTGTVSLTGPATISEGDSFDITLGAIGVADGTEFTYTVTGITEDDLTSGSLTGTFEVGTTTTASFTLATDAVTELESFTMTLSNGVVFNRSITDTSPSYSLSTSLGTVAEGGSVTITLLTSNVADGTNVPYTISGENITADDITNHDSLTGNFVVGTTDQIVLNIAEDTLTEGQETLLFDLDNGLATASSVIISDESTSPATFVFSGPTTVDEGESITITLTTTEIDEDVVLPYAITSTKDATDLGVAKTGNFTIDANGLATLVISPIIDTDSGDGETITIALDNGSASYQVAIVDKTPTYALATNANEVNEGGTFRITLTTTNVAEDTEIPYLITGVSADDINGDLDTFFTVRSDGTAIRDFTVLADLITDADETLVLTLDNALATVSVAINDTSVTPVYALTVPAEVNEGESFTFSATTNLGDGATIDYEITGIEAADLETPADLTGTLTVTSGAISKTIAISADSLTEGDQTATVSLVDLTASEDLSETIIIRDTSTTILPTYSLTGPSVINEGETLTITLTTTNVADGDIPYIITGVDAADISLDSLTGGVIALSNNTGTLTFDIVNDMLTEIDAEILTIQLVGITGVSYSVTIMDTSQSQTIELPTTESFGDSADGSDSTLPASLILSLDDPATGFMNRSDTDHEYFWVVGDDLDDGSGETIADGNSKGVIYTNNARSSFLIEAHADNTNTIVIEWAGENVNIAPGRSVVLVHPSGRTTQSGSLQTYTVISGSNETNLFRDFRVWYTS